LISRWRGTAPAAQNRGSATTRVSIPDVPRRNHERPGAAPGRASSRRDLDLLDESPAWVGDRLTTRTPVLEHQLDRVADHLARLLKVLALAVDFGKFGHVNIDPAVPGILKHRMERERAHAAKIPPAAATNSKSGTRTENPIREASFGRFGRAEALSESCVPAETPSERG
jgi:hypothetical protein